MVLVLVIVSCHVATPPSLSKDKNQNFPTRSGQLYDALLKMDSLLFERGFNNCDSVTTRNLISDDFEFYHDQSGITTSKESFLESMKGLCELSYKPIRKLVGESLEVFPLHDNGNLYGAITLGDHEFCALEEGKPEYLTSTAKFTSVWILENGEWKLTRALSFHHLSPDQD